MDREAKRARRPDARRDVLASMVAGSATAFVVTPFDVVTRRVQAGHFASPRSALLSLLRNEGPSSLFRGMSPTLVMFVSTNALYFPLYEQFRAELATHNLPGPASPLLAGAVARSVVATLSSPLEYLRTNMQATSAVGSSDGAVAVLRNIAGFGGRNLWSGLVPTLWRDVPFSAIYWTLLELVRSRYGSADRTARPWGLHFASACVAGSVAAVLTTPFDVIKTQMQKEASGGPRGVIRIARDMMAESGFKSLFRGLAPRVAKITPASAVMLTVFEVLRRD
jgi:solute carrier family 25 protein 39/40